MGKTKEWHLNKSETEIAQWINSRGKQISPLGRLILASEDSFKLSNALQTYCTWLEENETPFILYDDTILGSGKDGFLITNKYVYTHRAFSESYKIAIDDIEVVYGNGDVCFHESYVCSGLSFIDSAYRSELIQFLNDILAKADEQSEYEEDEGDIDETDDIDEEDDESEFYEDDENDNTPDASEKPLRRESKTRNATWEGILYEKYKIGRGTLFEDAIEILENDGWMIEQSPINEDIMCAYSKEKKSLYGFPIMSILLSKDYNESLDAICCLFPKNLKEDFSLFLNKEVFEKYNFLEKYSENTGLHFYAPEVDTTGKGFFEKIELEGKLDYSRSLTLDNVRDLDAFACYSFLSGSYWMSSIFKYLEDDWKEYLVYDTEDDAEIKFGDRNYDYEKEDFFKLLLKWEDVLSREDADISLEFPPQESFFDKQIRMSFNEKLNFWFYKKYAESKVELNLYFRTNSKELKSSVSMKFSGDSLSSFARDAKCTLRGLLYHLSDYNEDFDGVDMWDNYENLVEKLRSKEEDLKQKEDDEFNDDFDNL